MVLSMTQITVFDTYLQNRIASYLLEGKEPLEVARLCECSNVAVYNVKNSDKYGQIAYRTALKQLVSDGAPKAIQALIEIVMNKKNRASARVSAADKLLHHTGCIVNEQGKLEKSPANMTQAELQARLDELHKEASNRAQPPVIDGSSVDSLLD